MPSANAIAVLRPALLAFVLLLCSCAEAPPAGISWPANAGDAAPAGGAAGANADALAHPGPALSGARGAGGGKRDGGTPAGPAPDVIAPVNPAALQAYDSAVRSMHEGHDKQAEDAFLALSRSDPDLGGPHANLGILFRRADKLEASATELEKAVKSNPGQPVYWNELGITYRRQGQFAKARGAYEKSISLDPGYPAPNLNLGILFDLYLWDSKRALELYDRYLVLTPGGDEKVSKWVADLRNRSRDRTAPTRKEPK